VEGDRLTVGNELLRIEFNEQGVHPYASLMLQASGGDWEPAVFLGAKQARFSHRGASFPRLFASGREHESGAPLATAEADGEARRNARFTDVRGGFEVTSVVSVEGESPIVHVAHTITAMAEVGLNRVFDRYDFIVAPGADQAGALDYSFVPHLRPEEAMVIGDHVFRSPVIMMEKEGLFFALVPDLEMLAAAYGGRARYYLDLLVSGGENRCPALCFGLGLSRQSGHVYFRNRFGSEMLFAEGETATVGYYLFLGRDNLGPRDVLSFMWERFAGKHLESGMPQVVSLDRYASAGLTRMFKRPDVFRSFELDGQPCGGTVGIHLVNRRGVRLMDENELARYLRHQDVGLWIQRTWLDRIMSRPAAASLLEKVTYRYGPKVPPQIFFQSWFNNLRSAYGAYWFARKWNDQSLRAAALAVKNLVIQAPREQGAFPAVCYAPGDEVTWSRGTQGFKHVDRYNTADCATTAYYMALWFRDHEGDPRLLMRCRELADFLVGAQLPSGAFPSWVEPSYPAPVASEQLRESATTACPGMFLAMLFLIDADARHLDAALRAADFLGSEVIPSQKWFDFETFFSCSQKRLGLFDRYTGTYPQNTMSMYWAAEMLRLLYVATCDKEYLDLGLRVLDHLCLYQQVWDPPFLSIDAFGGFGVMNTDGEWNDARQGIIAPVLMDYYAATGIDEYMERGISALRASFTTMYLEENRAVAPGNFSPAHGAETGSVAENYGHFGYDYRTTGYLQSDWGAGSASFAAAYAQKHYGDVYVDLERMKAFGINGCRVISVERVGDKLNLEVEKHIDAGLGLEVKVFDTTGSGLRVEINGSPAERTPAGYFRALL
jgi:hypothetical protein